MKQAIFIEILNALKSNPAIMRKVKIFAAIGFVGLLFVGGLAIWIGASAFNYAVTTANLVASSPTAQNQIQNVTAQLQKIQFQPLDCWGKAQSLMAVEPWLARSAIENLNNLKEVCFDQKPSVCEGHECSQLKQLIKTADGRAV